MTTEPLVTIEAEEILWTYKDKEHFDEGAALAFLLAEEICFINSRHWKAEDKDSVYVGVNCNDVFAWACGDAEELPFSEIRTLYDMVIKDRSWGSAIWVCKRRGDMPQAAVAKRIREAGIWPLDEMGLAPNGYDAACREMAAERRAKAEAAAL
jgi:hypothetical protein